MRDGSKDDESSKRVVYTQKRVLKIFFCSFEEKQRKKTWVKQKQPQAESNNTHIGCVYVYIMTE